MSKQPTRFLSLDIFRGITVCFMIIVNTAGDKTQRFAQVMHADWHGFTAADWVFPAFLFAVGNALAFVMPKFSKLPPSYFFKKIAKRSAIIFILGFLMYWFPFMKWDSAGQLIVKPFAETRVLGVLQRIALCYFFASILLFYIKKNHILWVSAAILIVYWAALMLGGDANDPLSIQGNLVYKIDHFLIGDAHLWRGQGVPFDPEGLFSTLPAIVHVLVGYWIGTYLLEKGIDNQVVANLSWAAFFLLLVAEGWDAYFPMNKKLWTSSFVVNTLGRCCGFLAFIIYVADVLKKTNWASFFIVFGKNALFIYLFSEILAISLKFSRVSCEESFFHKIYASTFGHIGGKTGSLLFAISYMLLCWLVAWFLDKRRIYIKV